MSSRVQKTSHLHPPFSYSHSLSITINHSQSHSHLKFANFYIILTKYVYQLLFSISESLVKSLSLHGCLYSFIIREIINKFILLVFCQPSPVGQEVADGGTQSSAATEASWRQPPMSDSVSYRRFPTLSPTDNEVEDCETSDTQTQKYRGQ